MPTYLNPHKPLAERLRTSCLIQKNAAKQQRPWPIPKQLLKQPIG